MPVCPKCGHCFGGTDFINVASQINVAIENAVNTLIGDEKDEAERKRLHRLFRYWLSNEIRKNIGVSWKVATKENLDDVLKVIDDWMKRNSNN